MCISRSKEVKHATALTRAACEQEQTNGRVEADEKNVGKAALFPSASETINSHTHDAACAAPVPAPAVAAAAAAAVAAPGEEASGDQASHGEDDDLC